jgi:hypothetical protein
VINFWLLGGSVFLDNLCNKVDIPYKVCFSVKDNKGLAKFGWTVLTRGEFAVGVELQLRVYEQVSSRRMPINSFRNLARTADGVKYIREKSWIQRLVGDLSHADIMKKREALWTLGNIGSTDLGFEELKTTKAFEEVLRMGENEGHLSLRGTFMYIANLFSLSNTGRSELEKHAWLAHWSNNMGWICMPKDLSRLFRIKELRTQKAGFWPLQARLWQKYDEFMRRGTDEQARKLMENISLLCNDLTSKTAMNEINRILREVPSLTRNKHAFLGAMMMLQHFNFRPEARCALFIRFTEFFRNPQVASQLDEEDAHLLYEL